MQGKAYTDVGANSLSVSQLTSAAKLSSHSYGCSAGATLSPYFSSTFAATSMDSELQQVSIGRVAVDGGP